MFKGLLLKRGICKIPLSKGYMLAQARFQPMICGPPGSLFMAQNRTFSIARQCYKQVNIKENDGKIRDDSPSDKFQENPGSEADEGAEMNGEEPGSGKPTHFSEPPKPPLKSATKEQLLARANTVLARVGIRFKWLLKKSNRPFNTDDYLALFSWLVVGNVFLLILGTTTFVLLVIFTINPIFSQEFVARKVGEIMTQNSNLQVTFEHAIVPGWRDGKISFKKCFVSRRPKLARKFVKGSQADAFLRSQEAAEPIDDGNYTQFDLTIEEVNVSFSFRKWMNGTGIIDTMEIKGLRGIVDRTHVHWAKDDDATNYKNKYHFGDFEFNNFVMKDVLFTLLQPAAFRPFKVAIYNCELEKLRKHWLFYDLLNANNVSGLYDDSLFTVHKRQRLDDFEGDVLESELPWKRVTRLRVDSLSVDHLNKGLEGPFGWISAGKVDMMGDVMVPEDARDYNVADIVQIVADSIHKEATRYRNPGVAPKRESRLSPEDVLQFFVLDLTLRLNNVRALVPFQAPELSYVNYALIRPIVAYINLRNAFIEIEARVVKLLADFAGSWTVYDSLLMDDISELVYDSFVNYVADDESRLMRMRKIAFWSVQVLVQVVVLGLGALT
ncbi:distribution and morphology protein 31 [Metschnikowia aff. pulcherrima]|uniref:Distribution and morphology protein 31 n=1 Tax=Metschnikowia aff. pulcherrima TaxID=2163413 RepID=A0A4P6XP39_9ASCO|nr:distribution and morphology protein 31 [Metschnikowia aff. pulcherrima]